MVFKYTVSSFDFCVLGMLIFRGWHFMSWSLRLCLEPRTRNPEHGKGEGKKIGKKVKAREGKINFFFLVWLFMENSREKDKESIFPCLIIYYLKER